MILHKKYLSVSLFLVCSSGSIFSAYVFQQKDIHTSQKDVDKQNFSYEAVEKEIHMPLFKKKITIDFFDTSLTLASEDNKILDDEHVGFLVLDKKTFIDKLKTFVYQQIVKNNNSLSMSSDNISGKIFYSFVDENTCNVVVKWKNTYHESFQVFFDSFLIFIDH